MLKPARRKSKSTGEHTTGNSRKPRAVSAFKRTQKEIEGSKSDSCIADETRKHIRLTDGHSPMRIDDLAWPKEFRARLSEIVKKGSGNMLFAGPPGLGKTEAAKLMARLMKLDVHWLDACDGGLGKLKEAKQTSRLVSLFGAKRSVIIDEADSLSSKDLDTLRGAAMNHPDVPFILMCNDPEKISEAIRSRCECFIFDRYDRKIMRELKEEQRRRANEILIAEKLSCPPARLGSILSEFGVDFRQGLRALERWVNKSRIPEWEADGENSSSSESRELNERPSTIDLPLLVPDLQALTPVERRTADLFCTIRSEFEKHLVLPDGGSSVLAAFVMHAYAHDAADFSPILAITSPQKACGKSETMDLLRMLMAKAISTVNITPAALFERAEEGVGLLIDEADRFLSKGSDLIQLLNGGVKKGSATVYRAGNKSYRVWCPKVIARIGRITPDTLASRCIEIRMRRKLPADIRIRIRPDQEATYSDLRERCQSWADGAFGKLYGADAIMPPEFDGRTADKWRALFAIADMAGTSVANEVRNAARAVEMGSEPDEDHGAMLLEDIKNFFDESGTTRVFSSELVDDLRRRTDRPWSSWPRFLERKVARILADYDIRPTNVRKNSRQLKGYDRSQFDDAFLRYVEVQEDR